MATATQNDYSVTGSWTNLVATIGAAASVDCVIQNVSTDPVQVVFGGASAPTGKTGIVLANIDSVQGNAAQIWVRSAGAAKVSVTTL